MDLKQHGDLITIESVLFAFVLLYIGLQHVAPFFTIFADIILFTTTLIISIVGIYIISEITYYVVDEYWDDVVDGLEQYYDRLGHNLE